MASAIDTIGEINISTADKTAANTIAAKIITGTMLTFANIRYSSFSKTKYTPSPKVNKPSVKPKMTTLRTEIIKLLPELG